MEEIACGPHTCQRVGTGESTLPHRDLRCPAAQQKGKYDRGSGEAQRGATKGSQVPRCACEQEEKGCASWRVRLEAAKQTQSLLLLSPAQAGSWALPDLRSPHFLSSLITGRLWSSSQHKGPIFWGRLFPGGAGGNEVWGLLSLSPAELRVGTGSLPALLPHKRMLLGRELERYCLTTARREAQPPSPSIYQKAKATRSLPWLSGAPFLCMCVC